MEKQQYEYVSYTTRNLRKDLHRRVKGLAVAYGETMEEMVNILLEAGLRVMDMQSGGNA